MDVNSRDPSQNIIPFRIKGVDVARFDSAGNLGIGTTTPTTKLDVAGAVQIVGSLNIINTNTDSNQSGITLNGVAFQSNTNSAVVVNIDSQPAPTTALNRQKKQSIPLAAASTLSTSDVVAKMSGVSVGKSQTYGVGPSQMASYGNIVVAVGEGANSIAYSLTNPPTASSWVGVPNSANTFTSISYNIAYANGTWVAVGEGTNNIAYSTSTPPVASSWVGIPSETFNGVTAIPTNSVRNIAYGNGAWVVVGNSGTGEPVLSYSQANPPTAESWVGIPNTGIFPEYSSGITFGNGTWVLGGNGGGTNRIMYSTKTPPTADSWIGIPFNNTNDASMNNIITNNAIRVIYANGVWLAAGYLPNTLCYSVENPPIAGSWMPITSGVLFGNWCHSIAYGNGTWVACGESNALLAYSTSRIPHSSSWVSMKGPTPSSSGEVINSVTFNAATNTWYFMGDIGLDCMFYSTATPPVPATWVGIPRSTSTFDTQAYGAVGITTSAFTSPINVARLDNKVTFPANRMLAVGGGSDVLARSALTPSPAIYSTISYSDDDGATWQMVPGGAMNLMFSSASDISANTSFGVGGSGGANAVAWNGEKWVAAGNGRTHSLAFSDDGGMTWSGVTGKSIFSVEARDVAWNGQMWVAVGRGAAFSTAYSYDGITWMGPVDASGTPINVFSLDIAGPTAATSDISGGGNHVIWTGKMWVATGTRTLITGSSPAAYYTIAYSTDGKTWTGVPDSGSASTGFDIYAHGVAWNGRNYIATGRGTVNTLVYFSDVTGTSAMGAAAALTASWQGLGNSVFSIWGRGITWGAKRWIATGRGTNTVAYSTNGRNWQGCGANVFKPLRRFMAMGDTPLYTSVSSGQPQCGVAFSYSDDGITWDAPVVNQAVEVSRAGGIPGTTYMPNAFYVRTGGSNWREFIPLFTANTTTNIQTWGINPDQQFHNINFAQSNEIAIQFSYFAGYWLNYNRAKNGQSFSVNVYSTNLVQPSVFTFTAKSNFPVTTYEGILSSFNSGSTHTLNPQTDGINEGIANSPRICQSIYTNQFILTNAVCDNATQHTALMLSSDGGSSWARVPGTSDISNNGGTDMTVANNGVCSISMNPGRTRLLLGGGDAASATRKVYFSNDGFNWRNSISSPNSTQMAWVHASLWIGGIYNRWLIGGSDATTNANGRIMRSEDADAVTPWVATSPATYTGTIISCFAANTDFSIILAGAASGSVIYRSVDGGATWTQALNEALSISNIVASYNFDSNTNDSSPNNNTLTNVGSVTYNTSDYKRGTASASFNGSNYFQITNDGRFSPDNFTISFWIKPIDSAGSYQTIASCRNSVNLTGWILYISQTNRLEFWTGIGSGSTWNGSTESLFPMSINVWTHISITLNKSTTAFVLYINGNVIQTTGTRIYANNNGTNLRIGAGINESSASLFLKNGTLIDDFRIYNKVLTQAEINIIYGYRSLRSISFSPSLGRWVAVGSSLLIGSAIIYSTDATGTTWNASPAQANTASTAIFKNNSEATRVIWDALGGRFIVGGWNGGSMITLTNVAGLDAINNNPGYTMAYSADGINWTPVTVRSSDAGASESGPFLTRCRDLMALDTAGDFTPVNTGYSVSWNSYANRFVATGNGTCPVVYSNDGGVTWTPANQQPPQQAIAVAGGVSAAASTTSVSPLTYTIDGKTWFQGFDAKEIFGTGAVNAVEYGQTSTAISPINGRIWVAGGTHTSGTSCLAFSQNGIRWTAITNGSTMMTNVRTIVYAPAEQITGSNNAAITATSGVGNGVWVAGGDTTNSLIFSYDGISWSEVPNSLTILSRCNAIAFGNGLFVAGGVASSSGSTAVDATANIFYSTDGINWRPIRNSVSRISAGASISSITYGRDENGRGIWVAGATASPSVSVLYSYNGIDWAGVSNTISTLGVTSIAYGLSASTGRGLWIAGVNRMTADGNAFVFSSTGRDGWTPVPNTKTGLFDVSGGGPTSISYFNGVWYATGSSAGISTGRTLAYSYDGSGGWFGVYPTTNMYGTNLTTFSLTDMRCVATTNDYILPSGASAGSACSSGTAAASFRPAGMTTVRSIGWTAGVGSAYLQHPTILVGGESGRTTTAISGDGGRTWGSSTTTLAKSAFRGGVCNDLFWNGSIWVAVGNDTVSGAKLATSKDGISWNQIPGTSIPIKGMLNTIAWNGTMWMIGGDGSPTNDTNTASFAWSSNLTSWNAIANTDISLTVVKRIAWNGMYWVAVGQGSGVGVNATTIMYSKNRNGLVWEDTFTEASSTTKTSAITTVVNDIVWGGGRWVAVGRGNSVADGSGVSILYSVDTGADYAVSGRRWVGVAASAQLFPYGASSIAWNGKRFIATGPAAASCSTGNIIAWSADGISWTGYSTAKTVAPGQRWIAVGSGSRACIALSTDGRVWTDVAGTSAIFSDFNNATTTLVNTMKTGARAVGWNGSTLIVGGSRSATTTTPSSQEIATSSIGRTTIPVCAFIGSGNGLMGGGTTNTWDASLNGASINGAYTRVSSSVFITHMDVNIREVNAPWANMWLNTYTDLSATQLFQVTPEMHTFSSALKWNGWSWVANFGLTTINPVTGEQYGSIWFCTDPLARVGWSVASNSTNPRILIGQGGYAALEWNGVAWLACGYDPNNNNLIYTTDKYGAIGWTAVSGIVSGPGSASFQPVCIASSSQYWVVGGSQGTTSAMYFTSDRTGATGWRAIATSGGSVLPGIRISSVAYNGTAWICCGGGGGGSGSPASSISWRADTGSNEDIGTGWATATNSATSGGIPPVLSNCSAITYNSGANSPIWMVVGDVTSNTANQVAYTTTVNGSNEWKLATGIFTNTTFGRLTGIAWTGYSWIATSAAGSGRILSTMNINGSSGWNTSPTQSIYSPTLCTNAVTYVNIPISLLTTGMHTSTGVGAGTGSMWRAGVGRAQGLLQGGGTDTTAVVVRSSNGAEGTSWSQTYSRNFLIAVGGGAIRDAINGGGTNRMAYSYDGGLSWTTNNTSVLTNAASNSIGTIRTVKYGNGIWVAGGDAAGSSVSGNNCLAWSRDGVNWSGAGGTQIFGSAGSCYAVCCNDRGRWVAVGGSPLTTAGTYTNTSGSIYTMAWSDDGQNWTPILGSRAIFSIVCQGVSYGADASGVGMWTAIGRGSAYTGCAYSYDAKTWFLSQTSGSLFGTTVNVLTERYAPVASANWIRVSVSSSGQYQTAVVSSGGNIWTSSDYGVTWTARTAPGFLNWSSVSLSSTGQYQGAAARLGGLWFSSDYGVTWVLKYNIDTEWRVVALSSTGQYVTAVSNTTNIWTSSNYGDNFTSRSISTAWFSLGMSSTGQYQTAGVSGTVNYISSDYGLNWVITSPTNQQWRGTSLSSTGQYQTSVVSGGNIWRSTNYGQTWASTAIIKTWIGISLSSTGQYQTACAENPNGVLYTSSNYGETWSDRSISGVTNYLSVSISSTGQYQTVVVTSGLIYISSNFGETWSAAANDSRSLSVAYGKDANGTGMWVATAGRRDRDISPNIANTMAYSYDGKLWRGITAAAGLSEQAWSVAYGKDGFGVGMWVAAGYDTTCGLKWSYDGVTWNASTGASGASVWTGMAAGRRVLSVYWNGSMWLASTSDTRNGEPRGTLIAANNASSVPGYLLYSYNGKNWLPVLAPNTYDATISTSAQASIYSVLPNPAILDFGSFYDDQSQRGTTIANTTAGKTIGAVMSGGLPIKNINTIVPYGKGSLTTGQVPFLLGGDSGLVEGLVSETTQRFANYSSISSSSNAYDNFIPGVGATPTQSANNQWQYFDVNQNRTAAVLLSQWDAGGNPVIPSHGQWDNNIGDSNDYPFIQKVTTGPGPALVLHPAESNTNNIGLGYKNITTDTINVIIDIKVSLLFPASNTADGIEYYIQRELVGSPRYRIYTNSIIPQLSTAIHSYNDTIELQSGEFIYLIVNRRGAYGYDFTRVEFNVNIVNTISALVATLVRQLYYNNPITSEIASATTSLSTSTDGGITWRAVPNSTNVMTKVNKILCDESTQQIVAVGTGNYSVATSTPAKAADADGWVGVFGSRMTDTRAGLFEKYGTGASWFGSAKMWIASGRPQSRRGSSLAVSVNGTVWQDAKIMRQVTSGIAGAGRGGGLTSRTTTTLETQVFGLNSTDGTAGTVTVVNPDEALYSFSTFRFHNANATGRLGPTLTVCRTQYLASDSTATWAQDTTNKYLDMSGDSGIQLWTVPATGSYTIRAVGAGGGGSTFTSFGRGRDIQLTTKLLKGEVIRILVGQQGTYSDPYVIGPAYRTGAGGGGTFVVRDTQTPIIVAGGGGGTGYDNQHFVNNNANLETFGFNSDQASGGTNGQGGMGSGDGGGGGIFGNGSGNGSEGGLSFINGGLGGIGDPNPASSINGGFGGGGGGNYYDGGGGGGGYSGGAGSGNLPNSTSSRGGGGGGSFGITTLTDFGATNTGHGSVTITATFIMPAKTITSYLLSTPGGVVPYTNLVMSNTVVPYTSSATPLLTYTDSAAAFSTHVNAVAVNSQYNRVVVGGSSVQFVAGGRDGNLAYSDDGEKWTSSNDRPINPQQLLSTAPVFNGYHRITLGNKTAWNSILSNITVECWFRTIDTNNQGLYATLVSRWYGGGTTDSQFTIGMGSNASNKISFSVSTNTGGVGTTSPLSYNDTFWHHAAGTYNSTTKTVSLYIDGVLVASTTNASAGSLTNISRSLIIGSDDRFTGGASDRDFRGAISDVRIWNVARSAAEIASNYRYRLNGNESGLAGYWILDQPSATDYPTITEFRDSTANANHSASQSFSTWTMIDALYSRFLFHPQTNATTRTGSGGFDASFGTVALTQRLTPPTSYATGAYNGIAVNETGQYQTAGVYGGLIYTSSDYGVSWTSRIDSTTRNWNRIGISSSGQYQTAAVASSLLYTSSDFGVTWTSRVTGNWSSVSVSSTGQYQTAVVDNGLIWTSADYGVNWTGRATARLWNSVSVSSTGQYQTAVVRGSGGQIWVSSDYGFSWSSRGGSTGYAAISMSSSGQYQTVAVENGNLFTSNDFGTSWTIRAISANWTYTGLSVSSTGQYQTAIVYGTTVNGFIYISSDYGVTWTSRVTDTTREWRSCSISGSGQYQSAGLDVVYTSSDFGNTWVRRSTATRTNTFTRVRSSASGQYQVATSGPVGNTNGQFYVSSDYGQSWIPRRGLGTWLGGAVSGLGSVMMITARPTTTSVLPNAFYVRTGGTNWRNFIPLLVANSTTNIITWTADTQWYTVTNGNEIKEQFSYFAAYWLSINRAVVGTAFSIEVFVLQSGILTSRGIFTFTATAVNTDGVLTTYKGALSTRSGDGEQNLVVQQDGINAGVASRKTPLFRSIDYGSTFSVVDGPTLVEPAYWKSIAVTNSADIQTAVAFSGAIYRSSDYGASWSNAGITIDGSMNANTITPRNWQDIAISAETGAVQVTCVSGGYLYVSNNFGAIWVSSSINIDGAVTQTTNRSWQAVAVSANGQYGLACVNNGYLYISSNNGASWISSTVNIDSVTPQATNRAWQDVGMSANGKYQVACVGTSGLIYYSKNYGANWTSLTAAGTRAWSSVVLSENGSTISATTNDSTGGVWVYSMPDDQYYQPSTLTNTGATNPATIRAIAYGNSGTGAAVDGYWVAGADASANSLAYSSNAIDWTAVVGSKTTLFNAVNGVAYGADGMGTPIWVAVGQPFVGSVPGATAYSIAYSYNMTTWVGVRNNANFTGQGNHVTYGEDEFGTGMWVAVGQADGSLAANLGDSSFYNSNGNTNTTIFYSYDGANWAAATGAGVFAVSGTDVTWGVDASGVATWVATGIGYTNPLTGALITGGQVAYSTNGRVWFPIRSPVSSGLSATTLPATTRGHAMLPPPPTAGFITPTYNNIWRLLGGDIDGEGTGDESGRSVSISADGTIVAIGANLNDGNGTSSGHVRVYKYNPNKTIADVLGPASWDKLGGDIDGEAANDESGGWLWNPNSIKLSADGTVIAIGANVNDGNGTDSGHVRVYKYTPSKTVVVTNQADASFGPVGWNRLGGDIDGEASNDYSGCSIDLSSDGTVIVIGAWANDGNGTNSGHARVYKYTPSIGWTQLGGDINGEATENRSGQSVGISADGTTVAIGSHLNDDSGADAGHVRVYKYIPSIGWTQLGADIDGEAANDQSGTTVRLSADGTIVAIGGINNGSGSGHVRIYKYTPSKTVAVTHQIDASFGPIGWNRLGADIDGEAANDNSGFSIALSADGTIVAIGGKLNDGPIGTDRGHVRVYKYNPNKSSAITNQNLPNFGPVGWDRIGVDIDGEEATYQSGTSVGISADGTTLAVGASKASGGGPTSGHVRVYKLDTFGAITYTSSDPAVAEIYGNALLLIKDISAGTTTITATQAAVPPFTIEQAVIQGTLTVTASTTFSLQYTTISSVFTPFPGMVMGDILNVAYGRAGTQGTGAPRWLVGGSGGTNVFARSSRPSDVTTLTGAWTVDASNAVGIPFPICNSVAYSNGVWLAGNSLAYSNGLSLAGNNTSATNILARSTDGGETWTPITASSASGILAGAAAIGANSFCNFSLAVADYSNDTNLRSWIAVQGTKNFMFDGGVNAVATPTPDVSAAVYNGGRQTTTVIPAAAGLMVTPPVTQTIIYGTTWPSLIDITGEQTGESAGTSVTMSADGTRVAIGAYSNSTNTGVTRIYQQSGTSWTKLIDISGEQSGERAGSSVSMSADGTRVAVGSPFNTSSRGVTRIYQQSGNSWTKLIDISGETTGEQSGFSVSMSAHGTRVAVGAYGHNGNTGVTRIYEQSGNSWTKLVDIYGEQGGKWSGISVCLSANGNRIAIGTIMEGFASGNVRVYEQSGNLWPKIVTFFGEAYDEQHGRSISMSANGTRIAVGAWAKVVNGVGNTGAFRIFEQSGTSVTSWTKLVQFNGEQGAESFGGTISMSADGTMVAVGAYANTSNRGITRIYQQSGSSGTSWTKLIDINGEQTGERAGSSVSMSADGTRVAIGASGNTSDTGITRIRSVNTTNAITYTNSNTSVAEIYGNRILLIKSGASGTSNITATQGSTTTNGVLTVSGQTYTITYEEKLVWWVAGGRNQNTGGRASIAYTFDPSGATGWTLGTSNIANGGNGIANLEQINAIKFSPHTQNWLAVGVGSAATPTRTALYSTNGISWTSAVVSSTDASLNLNTCAWNQLDVSASAAGRWIAGGTRSGTDSSAASLYISTDVSGNTWTPIVGTGAILSQVYSVAFNGSVWIAAGAPATNNGSTSTLMRTTDPSGASGWQGIAATNVSTGGFDTAARSVTWNAEQQIWIATGENTAFSADASFSSVIYSRDATGAAGTWRSVRESNSFCFSGEGMGVAFKGDRWFASGQGTNQIVATTGSAAANASTATWTPITHGSSMTSISDIAYTGRRLIATGSNASGTSNGIIYTTDNSGSMWNSLTINALQFNGTTNFIDFGANITELGKASFTIEFWVKTSGTSMGLLNCQDGDSTWESGEKSLYIDSIGRPVFVGFGNNFIYATTAVNDNTWHHLAVTWLYSSGTSGTGTFYIDGINKTGTNYTLYPQYVANSNNTGTFVFGKPNHSPGEGPNFFNGAVCELRIWNVARSANEINQNYSRMLAGNETGLVAYNRFNQGIAGGTNTSITTVTNNKTTGGFTGTLSGSFTLTGTSSNWVSGVLISLLEMFDSGTSITFEPSIEGGAGPVIATGRSATNSLSISTDGGVSWSSPSVQLSTLGGSSLTTTQPLFTTGGNSVAYIGNDTLFAGGANDVQWTGKRWVATGRNTSPTTSTSTATSTSTPLIDVINNNTSAVATSDDGMTWQCVSSSQAPNLSDGTVIASNSRIGPTPLINSQIVISDGGDTEPNADYGGMTCGMGGSGTGIAQIDIIAELPLVSNAASSGSVNNLGAAGNAPNASFDTTAFAITTRPI